MARGISELLGASRQAAGSRNKAIQSGMTKITTTKLVIECVRYQRVFLSGIVRRHTTSKQPMAIKDETRAITRSFPSSIIYNVWIY